MNFRRRKRAMHHAEAHSESEGPARVMAHESIAQGQPELIDSAPALLDLVDYLRGQPSFAYDTEFIGEETFHPRICLIQVATTERVALVDPFAVPDLGDLWRVICDESHLTIVHAGGQDVQAAQRAADRPAANVFDTQIGGALAGMPWPASLGSLIEALCGHRLLKGHTFTEWDARPLTKSQLGYAADDVRYLPLAYSRLKERLVSSGRLAWATRECSQSISSDEDFDPTGQVKRACKGMSMRPRTMTVLRELVLLRYQLAREADVPPRTVIPDAPLLDLARAKPESVSALAEVRGLARPVIERWGERIVSALESARALPIDRDNIWTPVEESTAERMRIDALWSLVTMSCIAEGMAPTIVLTRAQLAHWYLAFISNPDLSLFEQDDWRQDALGKWVAEFVSGKRSLSVEWSAEGPRVQQ